MGVVVTKSQVGGVVTKSHGHLPLSGLGQTNVCENITFARFATQAVTMHAVKKYSKMGGGGEAGKVGEFCLSGEVGNVKSGKTWMKEENK